MARTERQIVFDRLTEYVDDLENQIQEFKTTWYSQEELDKKLEELKEELENKE